MTDVVLVGLITASAGIIGAAVGFCGTFIVTNRTAKFEERKHFRELGMQVALTKFRSYEEMAQQMADATHLPSVVPPFSVFVVDGIKTMEIVSDRSLSADEVGKRLTELDVFNKIIIDKTMHQKHDA